MKTSSPPSVWSLVLSWSSPHGGGGGQSEGQGILPAPPEARGPGGPHTTPTLMSPDPADAGPGHHPYRQGASSFPVLSCASFFFFLNLLSFQKWHKAIQSPGVHLSFVRPPPALFISFSICSGCPSGHDTRRCCYRCRLTLVSFALERILVGSNAPVETQAELSSFSIILF